MKNFYVGITDNDWYRNLAQQQKKEVNFWKPSGMTFKPISIGEPFLMKLKKPFNHIAGVGFFSGFFKMPLSYAWYAFKEGNGFSSDKEFRKHIFKIRQKAERDPEIGCIVLNDVSYLPRGSWLEMSPYMGKAIQTGKTFDMHESKGQEIWKHVQQHPLVMMDRDETSPYSTRISQHRLGQGGFRTAVAQAYNFRCAMTGEKTLPVLQAAHIKPYSMTKEHRIKNGLMLRSDFHQLLDCGLVTVTPEMKIEISPRIREEWFNGKAYYRLHGKDLELPNEKENWPAPEYLRWHNENVYEKN